MWQVLLAAAVAGSTGFVAKHFLNPNLNQTQHEESPEPSTPPVTKFALFHSPRVRDSAATSDRDGSCEKQDQIFRFSSSGSGGARSGSKNPRKKTEKRECKSSPSVNQGSGVGGGSRRKFYVCLKKRKTGKNFPAKCGPCSSKDSSSFKYGLGVGIMYMMSAGKAEISKLNTAMEETAKVVNELKVELERRKSSQYVQNPSSAKGFKANSRDHGMDYQENDDGEHASSVLTEERERELIEMSQLEAELELELQKLPWCMENASCQLKPHSSENEVESGFLLHEVVDIVPSSCEFNGVSPSVLNQKLSHLLMERQESQIAELETELYSAQSKLQEKESELQGLKDCVKHLTSFSLSNGDSDDEMDAHNGEEWAGNWDCTNNEGSESRRPVVGNKRPIDSES